MATKLFKIYGSILFLHGFVQLNPLLFTLLSLSVTKLIFSYIDKKTL